MMSVVRFGKHCVLKDFIKAVNSQKCAENANLDKP